MSLKRPDLHASRNCKLYGSLWNRMHDLPWRGIFCVIVASDLVVSDLWRAEMKVAWDFIGNTLSGLQKD